MKLELDVIERMGYAGYFLVVWEFHKIRCRMRYSRRARTRFGSRVARCMVCLGITGT
jgi:hypothetical protein